jgi:hypothetical protein
MRTNNNGIVWTVKMIERFQQLCDVVPALSYRKIAKIMSEEFGGTFTKNSCIGKARRLSLPQREPAVPSPGLTIYELRDRNCKWPLGPNHLHPPYFYCGKLTVLGHSYCRAHMNKAHGRSSADNAKTSLRL